MPDDEHGLAPVAGAQALHRLGRVIDADRREPERLGDRRRGVEGALERRRVDGVDPSLAGDADQLLRACLPRRAEGHVVAEHGRVLLGVPHQQHGDECRVARRARDGGGRVGAHRARLRERAWGLERGDRGDREQQDSDPHRAKVARAERTTDLGRADGSANPVADRAQPSGGSCRWFLDRGSEHREASPQGPKGEG